MRYPKLELEEDPFIDYPEDQNVSMVTEVPFDNSLNSSSCLDAQAIISYCIGLSFFVIELIYLTLYLCRVYPPQ